MAIVSIGPEAADLFDEILSIICQDTLVVSIVTQCGRSFGAIMTWHSDGAIVYEGWDEVAGLPNGEPMTIDVQEIAELRVY
jgi:hypothetical protein